MKAYLAVDIGASSGRHILGWVAEGTLVLREVHRFSNRLHSREGHLCWDMEQLFAEIVQIRTAFELWLTAPKKKASIVWGGTIVIFRIRHSRFVGYAVFLSC